MQHSVIAEEMRKIISAKKFVQKGQEVYARA